MRLSVGGTDSHRRARPRALPSCVLQRLALTWGQSTDRCAQYGRVPLAGRMAFSNRMLRLDGSAGPELGLIDGKAEESSSCGSGSCNWTRSWSWTSWRGNVAPGAALTQANFRKGV